MVDNVRASIDSVIAHGGELVQPMGVDAPEITARFTDPASRTKVEEAGITAHVVDLGADALDELPDDFTYVLHLAYFRGGNDAFGESFRTNAEGTGLVLQHCRPWHERSAG